MVENAVLDHLLTKEGVKSNNQDAKLLFKYYGYTSGDFSAFSGCAKNFQLPDELVDPAKKQGMWSVYLGDPSGFPRHRLVRSLLSDGHFREYLEYGELLNKENRSQCVTNLTEELEVTQTEIEDM